MNAEAETVDFVETKVLIFVVAIWDVFKDIPLLISDVIEPSCLFFK
jgi:hypothetical protein